MSVVLAAWRFEVEQWRGPYFLADRTWTAPTNMFDAVFCTGMAYLILSSMASRGWDCVWYLPPLCWKGRVWMIRLGGVVKQAVVDWPRRFSTKELLLKMLVLEVNFAINEAFYGGGGLFYPLLDFLRALRNHPIWKKCSYNEELCFTTSFANGVRRRVGLCSISRSVYGWDTKLVKSAAAYYMHAALPYYASLCLYWLLLIALLGKKWVSGLASDFSWFRMLREGRQICFGEKTHQHLLTATPTLKHVHISGWLICFRSGCGYHFQVRTEQ